MKFVNISFSILQKVAISNLNIFLNLERLTSDDIECIEQTVSKKIVELTNNTIEEDFDDEIEILKSILESIDNII